MASLITPFSSPLQLHPGLHLKSTHPFLHADGQQPFFFSLLVSLPTPSLAQPRLIPSIENLLVTIPRGRAAREATRSTTDLPGVGHLPGKVVGRELWGPRGHTTV